MTRFVTAFAPLVPVNIEKDVGAIPRYLARELGWDATLAYAQRDEAPIRDAAYERDVRLLRVAADDRRWARFAGLAKYVVTHAPSIDVLQLYHFVPESFFLAWLYALRNAGGVCFVKLDMDERAIAAFASGPRTLKERALYALAQRAPIDFFTVETSHVRRAVAPVFAKWKKPLHLLPSGFATAHAPRDVAALRREKEPLLLYAGHIGRPQKNVALLLDALERIEPEAMRDWKIVLAGEIIRGESTPCITERLDALRARRPDISDRLGLVGHITDRDALYALYRRARVFCLPSRWESFGLVLAEAAAFGCSIVSTNVGAAADLTDDGRLGWLVPSEDADALSRALREAMAGGPEADRRAIAARERIEREFDWHRVVRRLADMIGTRERARTFETEPSS